MKTILLFSQDLLLFSSLENESSNLFKINRSESLEKVNELLVHTQATVILIDIDSMPLAELDYISYVKQENPTVPIIIIASVNSLDAATRGIRSGASLYLLKPITASILSKTIEQLSESSELKRQNTLNEQKMLEDMMGGSPALEKVLRLIMKVAPSSATVLLGGENGTGKEFFAQIVHKLSKVKGLFVPVNCGAIPENLFESELFGHKKGSFTGADADKKGLVEEADNGTLFLDEIGDLPLTTQVKLLRFLQEKSYKRVGEAIERKANTRVIAASNRNLKEMVKEGTFREDLFYRLHVFPITLPPLRDRKKTIPNLVSIFVHRLNEKYQKSFTGFTQGAEYLLSHHNYPGNIRELENIIEHAAILAEPPLITEQDLPEYLSLHRPQIENSGANDIAQIPHDLRDYTTASNYLSSPAFFSTETIKPLEEIELEYIEAVLASTNNNHTEAAKVLGISRSTLWRKLKKESQ